MSLVATSFPLTSSVSPSILGPGLGIDRFPGKIHAVLPCSPEAAQAPSWPIVQSLALIVRLGSLSHTALTGLPNYQDRLPFYHQYLRCRLNSASWPALGKIATGNLTVAP